MCFLLRFYQGLTPSIVVSDPDLIQKILVKNFFKFNGRPVRWTIYLDARLLSSLSPQTYVKTCARAHTHIHIQPHTHTQARIQNTFVSESHSLFRGGTSGSLMTSELLDEQLSWLH